MHWYDASWPGAREQSRMAPRRTLGQDLDGTPREQLGFEGARAARSPSAVENAQSPAGAPRGPVPGSAALRVLDAAWDVLLGR